MHAISFLMLGTGLGLDSLIGIGGLILTTLSIATAIGLSLRGEKSKLLTYEILSDTAILNGRKDLGHEVQLFLDGHVANSLRLVYIKLANAGTTTIASEDYQIYRLDQQQHPATFHALQLDFGVHKVVRYAI